MKAFIYMLVGSFILYIFVALCILVFIGALSLFFLMWLEAYGPVMIWP